MKDISAADFKRATGFNPMNDDLERCNCDKAGTPGHSMCGWDYARNMPRFLPGAVNATARELLECYDAMLARWWSNATQADKELGNRAATARARYMGEQPWPTTPPLEPDLGERRREAAERARTRGERE